MLPNNPVTQSKRRAGDGSPGQPSVRRSSASLRSWPVFPSILHQLADCYRTFLTSVAHPSMPSPLLPTDTSSLTRSIPLVSSRNA